MVSIQLFYPTKDRINSSPGSMLSGTDWAKWEMLTIFSIGFSSFL